MIITDKFVYIHMPKTGGTFVTQVLKQIHEARQDKIVLRRADEKSKWSLREFLIPRPVFMMLQHHDESSKAYNQHGKAGDIPAKHQHKPILTTVRNPYDRYVSDYEFRWWALYPPDAKSSAGKWLYETYPHFPDLSFAEYLIMINGLAIINTFGVLDGNGHFSRETILGKYVWQFIQYYFKNPDVIAQIDPQYMSQKHYRNDMRDNLIFLDTDNLNAELHAFLLKMEYDPKEIEFIKTQGKILPKRGGRTEDQAWEKYYTPDLKRYVRERESMIFELFPQFDVYD